MRRHVVYVDHATRSFLSEEHLTMPAFPAGECTIVPDDRGRLVMGRVMDCSFDNGTITVGLEVVCANEKEEA